MLELTPFDLNSKKEKTAIIIGGGFSGLAAGVFLDQLGFKITLVEKKPILGGRAYSFKDNKTSSWVDNGQHLFMGAYHKTIEFIENIEAKRHLQFQKKASVPLISDKKIHHLFQLANVPQPFNLLLGLIKMKSLSLKEKWNFFKLGAELKRLEKGKQTQSLDQSVEDWLIRLGQSENSRKNFWEILTLATLNEDPKRAVARMLYVVLSKGLMGNQDDAKLVLPCSHLNDLLAKPAKEYLEIRGHFIQTQKRINKVHILDNHVQGVETSTGEILKANIYISSVPFRSLLNIIPEGFVNKLPYFSQLKNLKSAPIISINLWFDRDIIPYPFVGIAGTKIHWFFNKNKIYNTTHPPYHYMGVISGAYSLMEQSKEEILTIALNELEERFPDYQKTTLIHALVNKETEATLSPTIESASFRPSQISPFNNFYVIGDWTKTGLPATIESAVVSARMAVDDIEKKII